MNDIRKQVRAQIIQVMEQAHEKGEDVWKAAEAAFPGVPDGVIIDAWCDFDSAVEDRWWQSLEKTIEGEIVKNAIAKTGGAA
ncbi:MULTISPECIES: hypothetical protein [unclassified Chelatococcus]|uniref:hypothetical protein n=1 Tax=unclassified Chelatococcus TaxID=2638111 RepID=UPI001BCF08A7|nr:MULTISPECIES: hypothetical protein [unclassified Chelatococcus]MBS7741418.1 hypothetical protein [Chelatococcus sp. HY11]MBX3546100.1 hypothetical protein [Chelatococcus sp.]MCO5077252.1 hypothetical protein [Chelatococcus sp.]